MGSEQIKESHQRKYDFFINLATKIMIDNDTMPTEDEPQMLKKA